MKILQVLALIICCTLQTAWSCFVAVGGCPNKNVTFWLYTNETQENPTLLNPLQINPKDFSPTRPVVILLHGFTGHRDFAPNPQIRPVLLQYEAVHVISIDYGPLAPHSCFKEAVRNVPLISKCLAQLINNLISSGVVDNNQLRLVGFSLGAQVAGHTSIYVNQTLHHITGLDPSKPLFVAADDTDRLNPEDADFVDIIHTDPYERGILKPMGHADFYVNFREAEQPGCDLTPHPGQCSHNRAPEYYAESIVSSKGFWGIKCESWYDHAFGRCTLQSIKALMGYHASPIKSGVYFLETYAKSPFAAGKKGAMVTDQAAELFDKIGGQYIDELEQKLERAYLKKEIDEMRKAEMSSTEQN